MSLDFSVLTPSYNQARWLRDNLKSVENQRGVTLEHLVADGGSTDDSLELVRNSQALLVSTSDNGQTDALRKLLANATGEFICWLNSDDALIDRRVLEDVRAVFDAAQDISLVYGHCAVIGPDNRVHRVIGATRNAQNRITYDNCLSQPAVFLRRNAIPEDAFREDWNMVMDRALWLQMRSVGRWALLDRVVAADRDHPARKSFAGSAEMISERRRIDGQVGVAYSTLRRTLNRGRKVANRISGAAPALSLARMSTEDRAFPWSLSQAVGRGPYASRIMVRQIFVPRRFDLRR